MTQDAIPQELVANYIVRRKTDLETLERSLAGQDLASIKVIAHQVKGNAISYGFSELGQIALTMDQATKSEDWETIRACISKFRTWLEQVTARPSA